MDKAEKINEFRQYMLSGHGRCFSLIQDDKELYRDTVMFGCLNDISYDLQCEGSRGQFMYNLALEYEESSCFLNEVIEKFLSADVNEDWHLMNHLCDILYLFYTDNGNILVKNALETKYAELYKLLMTLRWSERAGRVQECYEYLAITIIQSGDIDRVFEIISDIGAYFIRRRSTADDELRFRFEWLLSCTEEAFGQRSLRNRLRKLAADSKEIRKFTSIMFVRKKRYHSKRRILSADEFISKAKFGKITRKDVIALSFADPAEHLKIAEEVIAESSEKLKTQLLMAFTVSRNIFPLDPSIIEEYALSDNDRLRSAANDVLMYIGSNRARELAIEQLDTNYTADSLALLVKNCNCDDTEVIMKYLGMLKIDRDEYDWHYVILKALDNAENLPNDVLMFIYERSMCSCCRKYAVEELIKRGMFTEQMAMECSMDANSDIREIANT